jgi:hypothetical protein
MARFASMKLNDQAILDFLEFSEDSEYFDAFVVPESNDGMSVMGKNNKKVDRYYLLQRWLRGEDAGVFMESGAQYYPHIWKMQSESREILHKQWRKTILEEQVSEIINLADKYNTCRARIQQLFNEKAFHIIGQKRVIGCTTTGAAMYTDDIRKASPGIVLVEEAGEILETHIITA